MFDRSGCRKYLNDVERRRILTVIQREPDALRRAFALTLFHTGCRISEGLNLTAERVDLTQKSLVFETLKRRSRGHFRAVPIPEPLCDLLRSLLAECAGTTRVWGFSRPTAYRYVKGLMDHAGITGGMACPKGLRHAFAVACLSRKIPLTMVRKWMGHARLETTAIYLDVSGNEERQLARRLWAAE